MQEEIKEVCSVLHSGGVILYPTDCEWAIGCDATNEAAVKKLLAISKHDSNLPLTLLVDSAVKVDFYVADVPDVAWDLIELSHKPLTIIYPKIRNLADSVANANGSGGIRVTREQFSRTLCERFRKAIVCTPVGTKGATDFSAISPELIAAVDYAVKYRRDDHSKPVSAGIISLNKGGLVKIIRE